MKTQTPEGLKHKGPQNMDELKGNPKAAGDAGDIHKVKHDLEQLGGKLEELDSAMKSLPQSDEVKHLRQQVETLASENNEAQGNWKSVLDALESRIDDLQTEAALTVPKAAQPEGLRAMSREIFESEEFKGLWADMDRGVKSTAHRDRFTAPVKIPSITAAKAAQPVVISDVSSGAQAEVWRAGIVSDPGLPATLLSRIPKVIARNATKYVVPSEPDASRFGAVKTKLTAVVNGDPTPTNTATFADVDGFAVGTVVRFYDYSSDWALLGSGTIASINTSTKVVTFGTGELDFDATTDDIAVAEVVGSTAEKGTKPSGWVTLDNTEFTFETLAQLIPTTVNALNTSAGLRQFIEQKLPMRYERMLSYHLLEGSASSQLQGFRTKTGAQSYSWSDGEIGDVRADAIIRAAALIPWTAPIGVVMHQYDLPKLTQEKSSDGHYLMTNGFGAYPLTNVGMNWFLGPYELVFDWAATQGEFTAVNWLESSEFVDQDVAELAWGYIDDDWATNVIRARYENTVCHAIFGLWGYVVGTLDEAPSAV